MIVFVITSKKKEKTKKISKLEKNQNIEDQKVWRNSRKAKIFPKISKIHKEKEDSLFGSCFIEIFQEEEICISCEKEKIPKNSPSAY